MELSENVPNSFVSSSFCEELVEEDESFLCKACLGGTGWDGDDG
jgi:hypothetical protein